MSDSYTRRMSSIELEGIAKSWGDATALHEVSLRIEPGSFCVLLGPSGCGKSTTLRIIAGLESATSGQLRIDGRDVTALPPAQRGVAMVFQNYALFPHLNVADNITFGLSVRRMPVSERAERLREAASLLGLDKLLLRRPSQLSGGQQQRVALGRALVARARVCLMDEPLSNLDAQLRQEMRRELRDLQRQLGLTVVYVTHDQAEAMSMADQVVLLQAGRVEQHGAPRELYAKPATTLAARFIGTPPMNLLALDSGRIAGSSIASGLNGGAATLGIRPEDIALDAGGIAAEVRSVEYLGADLVLACTVGSQTLLVRTDGQHQAAAGQRIGLRWAPHDAHAFDAAGHRIDSQPSRLH
jgi:sn-glycerol 3-phosphate transport system ATP-binding protein